MWQSILELECKYNISTYHCEFTCLNMYHTFICDTERVSIDTPIGCESIPFQTGVNDQIDKFTKSSIKPACHCV